MIVFYLLLSFKFFFLNFFRQHLCKQQILVPKLDFLEQLIASQETLSLRHISPSFSFFKRKKPRENENLINFSFFLCLRDTPIFRIYDDPSQIGNMLENNAREFFDCYKKFNNFKFLEQKRNVINVPFPAEILKIYEEDFRFGNEKWKMQFLEKFYFLIIFL